VREIETFSFPSFYSFPHTRRSVKIFCPRIKFLALCDKVTECFLYLSASVCSIMACSIVKYSVTLALQCPARIDWLLLPQALKEQNPGSHKDLPKSHKATHF